MLTIIDRYLLRQIVTTCLVMIGLGLAILVLERVLRLFGLVADPNRAFSYVGQMLVLLLPHYLSIALPAAFFFGVLLTFRRLQARQRVRGPGGDRPQSRAGCSRRCWAWPS